MVGRLGTIAARQGLSIGLREAARKLCAAVASKPEAYAVKDIEYGLAKLQTAASLAEILLDDPMECQRFVASLSLSISEAIRSLETSLSVRQAAKPPAPEGRNP